MSISRKMSTKERRSESGEKDSVVEYPGSSGLAVIGKNSSCRRPNPAFSRYSPPENAFPKERSHADEHKQRPEDMIE